MKLRAILLGISLVLLACGAGLPAANTSTLIETSTTGVSTVPPTTIDSADGVEVKVTASPVRQPDGSIELCPPGMTGACPGIILEAKLAPELLVYFTGVQAGNGPSRCGHLGTRRLPTR